jgi:hypothetical protein
VLGRPDGQEHLFAFFEVCGTHVRGRCDAAKNTRKIGLEGSACGTHSMRPTKAALIYRRTKRLRAVQLLLGQTKLESTVRPLGIEVDGALEISEQTEA